MRHALLALVLCAPLFACPGDDEGETAATTQDASTGGTSAPATTGEPQGSTGSGGATTTGSSGLPGDDSSSGGGGADPAEACTASCEHLVKCGVEEVPSCGIPCSGLGGMIAGCEAEYLAQQACVVALSCEDLLAWSEGMMSGVGYPCADEDATFQGCIAGG